MVNQLVLTGTICKAPETRYNPAGIPLTRFTLEHRSRQIEAGLEREASCRIIVVASGNELSDQAKVMSEGQTVCIHGFIARADNRQGETKIILHAQNIQQL